MKLMQDKLVQIVLIWLAGVIVGLLIINQIGGPGQVQALDGAISAERRLFALFGGALFLGVMMYLRPQAENKVLFVLSLAVAVGAIAPEDARLIWVVAGAVIGLMTLILKGFVGKEAPAKPAKAQVPAPPTEPGGVEFRARVSGAGGGLSEETLIRLAEDPAFGEPAKAVLAGRLIGEAARYGWRPAGLTEAKPPPKKRGRGIRDLLQGGKRTIPRV